MSNIHVNNSKEATLPNKTAIFTSPVVVNTHHKCFSFKWVMSGPRPGNLALSFLYENETVVEWRDEYEAILKKNRRKVLWRNVLVDLPTNKEFKVSY